MVHNKRHSGQDAYIRAQLKRETEATPRREVKQALIAKRISQDIKNSTQKRVRDTRCDQNAGYHPKQPAPKLVYVVKEGW